MHDRYLGLIFLEDCEVEVALLFIVYSWFQFQSISIENLIFGRVVLLIIFCLLDKI
jgi:hypothetical protein